MTVVHTRCTICLEKFETIEEVTTHRRVSHNILRNKDTNLDRDINRSMHKRTLKALKFAWPGNDEHSTQKHTADVLLLVDSLEERQYNSSLELEGDKIMGVETQRQHFGLRSVESDVKTEGAISMSPEHVHRPLLQNRPDQYGRHGDLKPENILWFSDHVTSSLGGTLRIADSGFADSPHAKESRRPFYMALGDAIRSSSMWKIL
jgi:hypothetical protein